MEKPAVKQATSLRQLQEMLASQGKTDSSVTTINRGRAYVAPASLLDVVVERNIRPINWDTVSDYANDMKRGDRFPPIQVSVVNNRLLVEHGYHRALASIQLMKEGFDHQGLEVQEFLGNSADAIFLMLNSDASLPVDIVSRAESYLKLRNQHFTNQQIADRCAKTDGSTRTAEHVAKMLLLAKAEQEVKQMVRDDKITGTTVIELIQEEQQGGMNHVEAAKKMLANALAVGRTRAMPKDKPQGTGSTAAPKLKMKEVRSSLTSLSSIAPSLRAALDDHSIAAFGSTGLEEGEEAKDVELEVKLPASKIAMLIELLEKTEAPKAEEETKTPGKATDDEQQDMFNTAEA